MYAYDPNLFAIGWPRVGPQEPDRAMVRALLGVYAGNGGALTQIMQFFYNSLLCIDDEQIDLGDLFGAVSINTMVHLKRLGQLILLYGGDPRLLSYRGGRPLWWSSGTLQYSGDSCTMLRRGVSLIQGSMQEYRSIAAGMAPEPRRVIQRILLDQGHNLDLFQSALHTMGCGG